MSNPFSRFGAAVAIVLSLCASASAAATQFVTGTTGPGAFYEFAVPEEWNGQLIVYGHGIVDPGNPVAVPTTQDGFAGLRDALLARSFAVASSSYSENGYALKDAAPATASAVRVVRGELRTAIADLPGGALAGRYRSADAGRTVLRSLRRSSRHVRLLGGAVPEVQYLGDVRGPFRRVLSGRAPRRSPERANVSFRPGDPLFMAILGALQQGFAAPGMPTLAFATAAKLPFTSPQELIAAALNALGFNLRFTNDLLARMHGHSFFDNLSTSYPPAVDGLAQRHAATPDALNYLQRYYMPTGSLSAPMITLHTTRDPVVPLFHETLYGAVAPADLLVQQTVDRFGHCAFTPQEMLTAFDDLVRWVEEGTRPRGGDATTPLMAADR